MFKSRRSALRRSAVKGRDGRYKLEGNSNVTSNRVTIPPGFFCLGVKSHLVRKTPCEENLDFQRDYSIADGIHQLYLNEKIKKPRRSSRLLKKSEETQRWDTENPQYYSHREKDEYSTQFEQKKSPRTDNFILRNKSKSIFRKINERCAKAKNKHSNNFNYPISAIIPSDSKIEYFRPSYFCLDLLRELRIDLDQHDYLSRSKRAISEGIRDINQRLLGKMNPLKSATRSNDAMEVEEDASGPLDFQYVPRCDWIFETPPRQRVALPKPAEECVIQPAVIYTDKKRSNIYEFNPNVRVDLMGYDNRQNIQVDGRYMRPLASFEEKMEVGFNFAGLGGASRVDETVSGVCKRRRIEEENVGVHPLQFEFASPQPLVTDHFAQVMSRPTKTVKKMSRVQDLFRRRSAEAPDSTPTGVNLFQSVEEYERDFSFIEDNGTYQLVDGQGFSGSHVPHVSFKKELFKANEGKVFNFDVDEPNMFDFVQLADD